VRSSLIQHVAEVQPTEIEDVLRQAGVVKISAGYSGVQDSLTYHIRDARVLGITYTSLKGSPVNTIKSIWKRFPVANSYIWMECVATFCYHR
jgi:hypothetical protein